MYPYIYIKEGLNKCLLNGVEAGRHITQGIFYYYLEERTAKLLFEPMILSSQSN